MDALLGRAAERGINLIDTAECYGDHLAEALVGHAVARRRHNWIIATKFGHRFNGHMDRIPLWGVPEVMAQLEASLRALRTDYIDLYQFHSGPDDVYDRTELWDALAQQVKAGKIRHLGVSISSNENLRQAEGCAANGCGAAQIIYNRLSPQPEAKVFPACQKLDLGILARVPLARGFLSGKYPPGAEDSFPQDDVRSGFDRANVAWMIREAKKIRDAEVPAGADMAAWALAWCLKNPAVTCVIPGIKTLAQVDSNASAAALV